MPNAKTITEAIVEVLKKSNRPLSSREICNSIKEKGLYNFNTANAEHVVSVQLRRHCDNIALKTMAQEKYFTALENGTYGLKK